MHERAPVSQDTSLRTLTTKPSNSPHRIEPVSSTCVPEGETGKSSCKLCYSFIPAPFLLPFFSPNLFYNNWRCEQGSNLRGKFPLDFIPAPFLLPFFSPNLFYNNWRCEETAGRGLPLENFGVKTEEIEQVCVFSFICCFLTYFSFGKIFNCAISLHLSHSFLPLSACTFRGKIIYCPATAMQFRIPLSQPKTPEPQPP